MSGPTKNQHYIPQFYLKLFTDENERFCVYSINEKRLLTRQHPKKFAAKRYFYDSNKEELLKVLGETLQLYPELEFQIDLSEPQFVEKYFSKSESDAKIVIEKVANNIDELFLKENMQKLIIFFHDLCARTEFVRNQYGYFNKTLNTHIDGMNFPNKEKYKKYNEKETQLYQIFSVSEFLKTAKMLIENYDWFVRINKSEINFIIGDNPLHGIFVGQNDICFPISKRKAIILRAKNHNGYLFSKDNSKDKKTINLSLESISVYNDKIAYSYRYYFGDKKTMMVSDAIHKNVKIDPTPKWNF